jgi:hypothetical protein
MCIDMRCGRVSKEGRLTLNRSDRPKLWLEAASVLGVIAGLGLVAWELRQGTAQAALDTRAIEVAAYQDLIGQISDLNRMLIENVDFAAVHDRFFNGDTTLTPAEQSRMGSFLWLLFRHGDMAYYQYDRGILDRARLESALSPLASRSGIPGMREEWGTRRAAFAPSYQAYIDSLFVSR